ncbi:MAG: Mut7-C RNAse domain-containing protein [Candidatus Bathyarchaeota archaeon]|nr:MAG: Mut7-C RNAse domain-containing protein [Candidatus Bathyarchaeota archaeon]
MKFIADGMLGKLTRWLRMLGHDVEYSRSDDDKKLIDKAKSEGRTLLTSDFNLYQQASTQNVDAVWLESSAGNEKLADLAVRFNFKLEIDVRISRCPKCNTRIKPVSKSLIIERVPKATSTYYKEFWECPKCEQVYWKGAHWKRIEQTLNEARRKVQNAVTPARASSIPKEAGT